MSVKGVVHAQRMYYVYILCTCIHVHVHKCVGMYEHVHVHVPYSKFWMELLSVLSQR